MALIAALGRSVDCKRAEFIVATYFKESSTE